MQLSLFESPVWLAKASKGLPGSSRGDFKAKVLDASNELLDASNELLDTPNELLDASHELPESKPNMLGSRRERW